MEDKMNKFDNDSILVSVLMCTYHESIEWVRLSIDSIINQTYKNTEFIIMVDDPQNEVLLNLLQEYRDKYNFIYIYVNEKNLGLVKSLNKGLRFCHGKYILRMDADDISTPDRIEKELDFLLKNKLDLVGSCFKPFNENEEFNSRRVPNTNLITKKMLKYTDCLGHPTWLLKKEVYEKLGGYRDVFGCEDYDFLIRASLSGFKIAGIDEVLLKYRINSQSISGKNYYLQEVTSNRLRYYYRRNQIMNLYEYKQWIDSEAFRKKIENFKRYCVLKDKIKTRYTISFKEYLIILTMSEFYYNVQCTMFRNLWMGLNKIWHF